MKLTKLVVDKLPIPKPKNPGVTAQKKYYDEVLKGFGVRVTSGGTKAFFIEKLIGRKLSRITLGRYPALTVEMARKEAQKLLGLIATGIDPIAEKKAAKLKEITLKEVFEEYVKTRKHLKPKTLYDYNRVMGLSFVDWAHKPITSITKDKVARLHEKLGEEHGAAYANLSMRLLRALFNYSMGQYEDSKGRSLINENPVKRLSQTRAWYRVERRQSCIKPHELKSWFEGVRQLENTTLRDYIIFILFTGLRRQEAARLRWDQIDFNAKTFTIPDTKNNLAHILPLSDYLLDLLKYRQASRDNPFVFPSLSVDGYIKEPRKQIAKIIQVSGIKFTIHDLRRTFITIAESLDISSYALKKLLNHKANNDVTAGYIVVDVERLRKPMQQITDYILKCIGLVSTEIIRFPQETKQTA